MAVDCALEFSEFRNPLPQLQPYSRPLFVSITDEIEVTATFRHTKSDLVRRATIRRRRATRSISMILISLHAA
jgi:hypothetical protein